jgi:hypothetical protein
VLLKKPTNYARLLRAQREWPSCRCAAKLAGAWRRTFYKRAGRRMAPALWNTHHLRSAGLRSSTGGSDFT